MSQLCFPVLFQTILEQEKTDLISVQRGPVVDIEVRCDSNMRRKVQQGLQVSKCSGTKGPREELTFRAKLSSKTVEMMPPCMIPSCPHSARPRCRTAKPYQLAAGLNTQAVRSA
jgi:hypothetical protein